MDALFKDADSTRLGGAKFDLERKAREKDIPVNDLEDLTTLDVLLEKFERLEKLTVTRLHDEYESLGFVADDLMPRTELLKLVKDVYIWSEMKLTALQEVCALKEIEVDTTQPRSDLMKLLADSTWEALGIPVSRLGKDVAKTVLEQVRMLENCSLTELSQRCSREGLPVGKSRTRVTPGKLVNQLRLAFIWKHLPLQELRRDCQARSLSSETSPGLPEDAARQELCKRLVASLQSCTPEQRGIPVERLECPELAEELVQKVDRLQILGALSLRAECYRMNVVHNPVMGSQALVDRLKSVLIWQHMPLEELLAECREKNIFCLPEDGRDLVITNLLEAQDRAVEMAELGVPVQLLSDTEAATELFEQFKSIEMMCEADLTEWYQSGGLPLVQDMDKKGIQDLLKKVMAWEVLQLTDLQQECSRLGLPTTGDMAAVEDEEEQQSLKQSLIGKLVLHQCVEALSTEGLCEWYGSLGYPSLQGAERSAVQQLLRKILTWEMLPASALLEQAKELSLSISEANMPQAEEEQRQLLSRRLVLHECVEVMTVAGLTGWYEELGLPSGKGLNRHDLEKLLRRIMSWQFLSVSELEQQCAMLRVPTTSLMDIEDEEQRHQMLVNKLALSECINVLGTDDLLEWYEGTGFPLVVANGIKRKEVQKLLTKVLAWEALPLAELEQEYSKLKGVEGSRHMHSEEQERHQFLLYQLALHERIEGMTSIELMDWYSSMGLPQEKSIKRTELQKLMRKVLTWSRMPLVDLQQECEHQSLPIDDAGDEDEQRSALLDGLFRHDRMEAWEAGGFQAFRIGRFESACQVVEDCCEMDRMEDMQLLELYLAETGLPEERGMERADWLETLKAFRIWLALPIPELLKDCQDRCLDVPEICDEEQRQELVTQLAMDMRLKKNPNSGKLGGRIRLPRALGPRGGSGQARSDAPPGGSRPRPAGRAEAAGPAPGAVAGCGAGAEMPVEQAAAESPAQTRRGQGAGLLTAANAKARSRVPQRPPHRAGEDGAACAAEVAASLGSRTLRSEGDSRAAAVEAACRARPRLREGLCLFINLDRRTDRRERMERLAAPHKWLSAALQRIPAVDGKSLNWDTLVHDKLFTRQAIETARRAKEEKRATIGVTPLECSTHLTTGGFGCALSHKKAWETLVESSSRWALILEDDLTGICERFDDELDRVLDKLPADWNMCYLGFHSGYLIPKGARFQGPLRALRDTDGWLPGLWGYLISKACARQLLKHAFPMGAQIDTEVGCRVSQKSGSFVVPEREFLLFSPPTEQSRDSDVQTFQQDMH